MEQKNEQEVVSRRTDRAGPGGEGKFILVFAVGHGQGAVGM